MKEFETRAFKIKLHANGLKEMLIKENVVLQPDDVWESHKLSYEKLPLLKYFVLLQGEENSSVSPDARRTVASEEYYKNVGALALCSGKTTESIMGNLFLKINRPKVTTQFFDNRDKALKWLEARMLENK
jgi:hypothetical protein